MGAVRGTVGVHHVLNKLKGKPGGKCGSVLINGESGDGISEYVHLSVTVVITQNGPVVQCREFAHVLRGEDIIHLIRCSMIDIGSDLVSRTVENEQVLNAVHIKIDLREHAEVDTAGPGKEQGIAVEIDRNTVRSCKPADGLGKTVKTADQKDAGSR